MLRYTGERARGMQSRDLIEEAIGHALMARDASSATQLVEAHFFQAFKQEQLVQMEHWLRLLPEEQIQGSPYLLCRASVDLADARAAQRPSSLADNSRAAVCKRRQQIAVILDDPPFRLLHALIATCGACIQYFTGQVQASLESARSALAWIPPGEEYMVELCHLLLCLVKPGIRA